MALSKHVYSATKTTSKHNLEQFACRNLSLTVVPILIQDGSAKLSIISASLFIFD